MGRGSADGLLYGPGQAADGSKTPLSKTSRRRLEAWARPLGYNEQRTAFAALLLAGKSSGQVARRARERIDALGLDSEYLLKEARLAGSYGASAKILSSVDRELARHSTPVRLDLAGEDAELILDAAEEVKRRQPLERYAMEGLSRRLRAVRQIGEQ